MATELEPKVKSILKLNQFQYLLNIDYVVHYILS